MKLPKRSLEELRSMIIEVPDVPKPGISFKDATPIYQSPSALRSAADLTIERLIADDLLGPEHGVDLVVGAEARGFILGAAIAMELGAGFAPARKPGKLPRETVSVEYDLEYGSDSLHLHTDAIVPGDRVLLHDDLLATGGTAAATADLIERMGGDLVGVSFLIELTGLGGREKLPDYSPVDALFQYEF